MLLIGTYGRTFHRTPGQPHPPDPFRFILLWVATICLCVGCGTAPRQESVAVENLAGQKVNPFLPRSARALVFIFVSVECPVCNQYAPELNRLAAEFETKGIVMKLVYPNQDETSEAILRHARNFKLKLEQLGDPRDALVGAAGAEVTPEAAVFAPGRGFVYCGRVDDRYTGLGVSRPEATEHDLSQVIQAIVEHQPLKTKASRGVGCSIPSLK
jgi:thiol-disulfide isomerase/thioredoxin